MGDFKLRVTKKCIVIKINIDFNTVADILLYLRKNHPSKMRLVQNVFTPSLIFIPLDRKQKYLFRNYYQKPLSETMQLNTHN